MKRQLTGVRLKLVIGTIQEKLRKDIVARVRRDSDSMEVMKKITYPFMCLLKIDPVN